MSETCRWCGAEFDHRAERLQGRIRCAICGVATTHPWPTPEELDAAYADWYRPESGRFSGPGDVILRRSRATLAKRVDEVAPPGPVLDVGAGDGTLVRALQATGREALGLERGATGIPDVEAREVSDVSGQYAAVVFWHSLEHMTRPAEALAHAAKLLAPGGVVVVAVPNAASLQAQAFGDRWFGLDIPRHLVHLTPQAVARRCEELGLRVSRVSHLRGGQVLFGWLHGAVGTLGIDLYDAIRRPQARRAPLTARRRALGLAVATLLSPLAAIATVVEATTRRGGTFALEAVRV